MEMFELLAIFFFPLKAGLRDSIALCHPDFFSAKSQGHHPHWSVDHWEGSAPPAAQLYSVKGAAPVLRG